jgi:hypothetical protein
MKRIIYLAVSILALVAMTVSPALAADNDRERRCDIVERGDAAVCGNQLYFDEEYEDFDFDEFDYDEVDFYDFYDEDDDDDVEYIFVPYYYGYGDCGFDWDGPVTPADCLD